MLFCIRSKLGDDTLHASAERSSELVKQYRNEHDATSGQRWAFYAAIYQALRSITTDDRSVFALSASNRPLASVDSLARRYYHDAHDAAGGLSADSLDVAYRLRPTLRSADPTCMNCLEYSEYPSSTQCPFAVCCSCRLARNTRSHRATAAVHSAAIRVCAGLRPCPLRTRLIRLHNTLLELIKELQDVHKESHAELKSLTASQAPPITH